MRCEDWPDTLTATVEFYDADCGDCTVVVTLEKQACEGELIYTALLAECTGAAPDLGTNSIELLELRCTNSAFVCGTPEDPLTEDPFTFQDDFNGATYSIDLDTACCDPLYLQFTCVGGGTCVPFAMGGPTVTIRVTITA